jgi:pentatricopeptide repeat protein
MPDARLATTLIRVCSQHGQTAAALELYDWMRATRSAAGDMLIPTVFTYTAAMRAALAGNLLQQAFQVRGRRCQHGSPSQCTSF